MILMSAGFFAFVIAAVFAAGYFALQTRLATEAAPQSVEGRQVVEQALNVLGERLPVRGKKAQVLRRKLFQAGYRSPSAVSTFQGGRAAFMGLLAFASLWMSIVQGSGGFSILVGMIASGLVGFVGGGIWLDRCVRARADRIRHALPAALELVTISVEASQPLDVSIQNAAKALRRVHPDLCEELAFYLLEIRAGTSRFEALGHLAERSPEPELKKLAGLLIDAERFGNSLGPSLRTHAKFLRHKMRFDARTKARKLSVKLIFPVFFLIFPAVLLVTLGPAYLQVQQFFQTLLR
jgi:tight adherence protein C